MVYLAQAVYAALSILFIYYLILVALYRANLRCLNSLSEEVV